MVDNSDYQYVTLEGVNIAYRVHGKGKPFILVHGFTSFSDTWQSLIQHLPTDFCFYSVDLKGFGYSEKICDDKLSPFDQAKQLTAFIKHLDLRDIILAGHSSGGAAGSIAMFNEEISERVSHLLLINSAGFCRELPGFVDELSSVNANNQVSRIINEEIFAHMMLTEIYSDVSRITTDLIETYGEQLRREGAKECLVATAKQVLISDTKYFNDELKKITRPTLIIWGKEDQITTVEEAYQFRDSIPGSILEFIPSCGHSPQEEQPEKAAAIIMKFLAGQELSARPPAPTPPTPDDKPQQADLYSKAHAYKMKMRNLIDRWSIGTVLLIIFIKILQFLKKLGFKAEENGWRKASSVFFRNEHSKFCLGCFRLDYRSHIPESEISEIQTAKEVIIRRLAAFLRKTPTCQWKIHSHRFRVRRKKISYTDIVEANFDTDGTLLKLTPYFDDEKEEFDLLNANLKNEVLNEIITSYNHYKDTVDRKRHRALTYHLRYKFDKKLFPLSQFNTEMESFIDRILSASYIHFEMLPTADNELEEARLALPHFELHKHPGAGLINICCRFTPDYKEADLWMQYHHAPVDGAPMQQTIDNLRNDWGTVDPMLFPALSSKNAKPAITDFGDNIYRGRLFADFTNLLAIRKQINQDHYLEMGGQTTLVSMIIWGLSHYEQFKNHKFVLPVNVSDSNDPALENKLSLIIIRPSQYITGNPLEDFFCFQRAFNHHLFRTRLGKCETTEFMDLIALNHPMFYGMIRKIMPKALHEVIGSVCVSVIKEAEYFVAPLSDLQINGFIAIGSCRIPTVDQRKVGAISICGNKKQVEEYIGALETVLNDFGKFIAD